MNDPMIYNLHTRVLPEQIGNKANNLRILMDIHRIKTPKTWVIPWEVYQRYKINARLISEELEIALQTHIDLSKTYAIRSSSNLEDASFHSYAGLFKTYLNVHGCDDLRNAVIDVWEAAHTEAIQTYLDKFNLSPDAIQMAVIIQEMVLPAYSGVLFSHNPMTGSKEIVIEAVLGEGTALVQDGITPERWVSRGGSWVAKPDENQISATIIKKVLDDSRTILKKIAKPVDLEWVYDGQAVHWVQMREITTLKDLNIYSNRFTKDMMPGMIHPLIWSINIPLINTVWLGLLEEIVGKLPIRAEDLAKSFFYRSYFNMGAIGQVFTRVGFPSEGLEMMMGMVPRQEGRPAFKPNVKMVPLVPKLLAFIWDKWRFERKIQTLFPSLKHCLGQFTPNPEPELPLKEQVVEINQLYHCVQKIVYFNVVTPILASMYTRLLEGQLSKCGIDLLEFDIFKGLDEFHQYNPNISLSQLHEKFSDLFSQEISGFPCEDNIITQAKIKGTGFEEDFNQFISDFGHFSNNSNNFMATPWREDPDAVLQMIQEFTVIARDKEERITFADLTAKGIQKWLIDLYYQRVRKFAVYREQISQQYVYGYGLFRPYFFRLADGMLKRGWLDAKEDIFYLTWDEIQGAVTTENGSTLREKISTRQAEMKAYQDVVLPDVIYGDNPPPVFSECFDRLFGTPTSQGYYSGPAKIISGIEDFQKVQAGDVIVIPYSDVGWTPLFSLAGAVIAESGGLLSHSSIIAREYQIPAIVSVPNCMQLSDHQQVSVNGFTGEIVLLEDTQAQD
jgi:pyruvate,water dikinase